MALSGVEPQGVALWGDCEFILGHAGFEVQHGTANGQVPLPPGSWNLDFRKNSRLKDGHHLPRGGRELRGGEGSTQALWSTGM